MRRYLRLYAHFVRFSVSRALQFRFDFLFRVGMDALWYAHYLAFFGVISLQTGTLGGWTREQCFVFAGAMFVMDGMQMTFFADNMWVFPTLVNHGDLDYHLVRPVSTLFVVTLREVALNSFLNLLMAIAILVWTMTAYPEPLGVARILAFSALMLVGLLIHYCVSLLFLLPVFWWGASNGLRDVFWTVDVAAGRPVGIYTGWVRRILVTVLPLCVIVSFPVRALFEGPSLSLVAHMLAVAAGAFLAVLGLWALGLRAYTSASS